MTPRSLANREIDSALAELRRGNPIWLHRAALSVGFLSVEFAGRESVEAFSNGKPLRLLVSSQRARVLGLKEGGDKDTVVLELEGVSFEEARILANPLLDNFSSVRPSKVRAPTDEAIAGCAMRLAKRAELLPALLYRYADPGEGPGLDVVQVENYSPSDDLRLVATAPLPLDVDDKSRIFVFREFADDLHHHLALQLGRLEAGEIPLVRLHSECLTGDAFFSQKCDCGAQLDDAKQLIARDGGFLVYLREEGRKIGLVNKIRAYALQNRGLDTLDANLHIGFGADERDYLIAAEMLRQLGVSQVRLLTNNPRKAEALETAGIAVVECLPLRTGRGRHNEEYLKTKRDRSGHRL